jgi:hypothetical protein
VTPLQVARHAVQREALARREGERRSAELDHALAADFHDRRGADRRAEIARRNADRIEAARFNHALARWHDIRSVA